jgi:UPF0716 family protein affecting phage T7 exclusion
MLKRVAKVLLGLALVAAGIAMLVLPGPGLVSIVAGVVLVLSQFPRGQRVIARLRVWLRQRFGSPRVRRVESRVPDDVVPPADTEELRVVAGGPDDPRDDRPGAG